MTARAWIALALSACAGAPAPQAAEGRWVRVSWSTMRREGHWATQGRVNSPDTATGRFKDRPEAKADGRLTIALDEDPAALAGAELYLELWGGHPGTAKKAFTVNGRGPYGIPEVGAAGGHCTYSYPVIPLDLAHLVRGENVFQFTCERGSTFWGHYIVEVAALRAILRRAPPGLRLEAAPAREAIELRLSGDLEGVTSVDYRAHYDGYDENGDGRSLDWHGFTKERVPAGLAASAPQPPFGATWDVSMVPDQEEVRLRAEVRFKDGLVYESAPVGAGLPRAPGARVRLYAPAELPRPFWSRAGRLKTCSIEVDAAPEQVERAQLHVALWDGGKGKTPDPFTLNGHPLPVAGPGRHDLLYRVVPVDPAWLRQGPNEIRVLSDTDHHGLEILLPGPALAVRVKK